MQSILQRLLVVQQPTAAQLNWNGHPPVVWVIAAVVVVAILIVLSRAGAVFALWLQAKAAAANISIFTIIGMRLRRVDAGKIIRAKISLTQAGVPINVYQLEVLYLSGGDVGDASRVMIMAHGANIDAPWPTVVALCICGSRDPHSLENLCKNNGIDPRLLDLFIRAIASKGSAMQGDLYAPGQDAS